MGGGGSFEGAIRLLLWATALFVALLGTHVAAGYLRFAERETRPRIRPLLRMLSALALGTGAWAAMLLVVSSPDMSFPLGFRALGLGAAWACAVAGAVAVALLVGRLRSAVGVAVASVGFGAVLVGLHVLLVRSLGLLPGVYWRPEALAAGALLGSCGLFVGFWVALRGPGETSPRRRIWRWAGALAAAFGVTAAALVMMAAVPIEVQVASVYGHQVPAAAAALVAGVGAPLALLAALGELSLRGVGTVGDAPAEPPRKRKRRYYYRL